MCLHSRNTPELQRNCKKRTSARDNAATLPLQCSPHVAPGHFRHISTHVLSQA